MIDGIASSRRTGAACFIAGWKFGANRKVMHASRSTRAASTGSRLIGTPSASSTSAEPQRDVNERLPCFATEAPAPAATNAAAVEILTVGPVPPPVPPVPTKWSPAAWTGTIASRNARAAPATSSAVSPLVRSPMSRAAICAGVAAPCITVAKTAVVWLSVSERRSARAAIASSSGEAVGRDGGASGIGISGSPKLPRKIVFCQMGQGVAWLDWPPVSSYLWPVAPVAPATSRPCLAVVQYDGAQFVGWQRQREGRTVQADFEAVLERLMGRRTTATGAGRTDSGVHALGQGVGFAAGGRWGEDPAGLRRVVETLVPPGGWGGGGHRTQPGVQPRQRALARRSPFLHWGDAVGASPVLWRLLSAPCC